MLEIDLLADLEANLNMSAYPIKIPQNATYPAIVYKEITNTRSKYCPLATSNLRDLRYQITVVSPNSEVVILAKEQIINLYEGFTGFIGNSNIFNSRVAGSIPLFDNAQQNFEYSIDVIFTENQ